MEATTFFVNKAVYSFCEVDIDSTNLEFVKNFEPDYFEFQANHYINIIESEEALDSEKSHISILLRNSYSHALESFFAILLATIQSPNYIPRWLLNYANKDLYSLVNKIIENRFFRNKLSLKKCGLSEIIDKIFLLNLDNKEKEKEIKQKFCDLWHKLAQDFLNKKMRDEYNSIKHGFRVIEGGFSIRVAEESKPGKVAKEAEFKLLGSSKYGATYFKQQKISVDKPYYTLLKRNSNWPLKRYAKELVLISLSLKNIQTYLLKILEKEAKYTWPEDLTFLNRYLKDSPGVLSFNETKKISLDEDSLLSEQELIDKYDERFTSK